MVVVATGATVVVVEGATVVVVVRTGAVVGGVIGTPLVKVASVNPGPMRTTTVPPATFGAPTWRAAGATAMAETSTPLGVSSDTTTSVATRKEPATTQ